MSKLMAGTEKGLRNVKSVYCKKLEVFYEEICCEILSTSGGKR